MQPAFATASSIAPFCGGNHAPGGARLSMLKDQDVAARTRTLAVTTCTPDLSLTY